MQGSRGRHRNSVAVFLIVLGQLMDTYHGYKLSSMIMHCLYSPGTLEVLRSSNCQVLLNLASVENHQPYGPTASLFLFSGWPHVRPLFRLPDVALVRTNSERERGM